MLNKKQQLMIIDGNALIHRSFHALPPTIATKKGEMVNAVYGFTTVLLKALREFEPNYVVLTLDRKEATFRHKEYKEYKAKRVKAPDELYAQIPRVKEIATAFGIPIFELAGFEADDLIGTIAKKVDSRVEKIILTGDMDTLQLVDDHTKVYTMSRGLSDSVLYDEKMVSGRFGLSPSQMIDFKALRGDPSDNIPGVRGIGEKTAVELLREFKTLDGVYKYLDGRKEKDESVIRPRIIELLKQYKQDAYLSKKLATINCAAPIDFSLEKVKFGDFDKKAVFDLFSELEFKSLLPRIQAVSGSSPDSSLNERQHAGNKFERNKKEFKYILVNDEKSFKLFLEKLIKQKEFVFDTETASFDPFFSELLGISFSWKEGEAYFIQLSINNYQLTTKDNNLFNYNSREEKQDAKINQAWLEKLKPVFEDEKIKKCGHNIKFDIEVMESAGIKVKGVYFDTMIASYLLNPGTRQHNLDALAFSELGFEKISKEDLLGKGKDKITFSEVPLEKLYLYSCEDADFTFRLEKKLEGQLKKEKLESLFKKIEMPLVEVLVEMERNGIKIDEKFLGKIRKQAEEKIKKLEEKIKKEAKTDFNINSTQQLREVLFNKMGISAMGIAKGKTGFSTSASELEKLRFEHPIIEAIMEYRELAKLLNTYINALPELVSKKTGRLHTSFNQTVTATGRLSSSEPNLQNIPIRTETGKKIREAFVADEGYKLVGLDYSQIELRLAAHFSEDVKMMKAFREGEDIHIATAAEINGVKLEDVTKQMRREAKAVNFGIIYGQGPHGLSEGAGIPYARAKDFIENYFKVYKGVKNFIDSEIERARERGFAETLFGRRRYLPEINSSVLQVKKGAERMAINTPLQGTAADIIKVAMIGAAQMAANFNTNSHESEKSVRMLLQVHDELLFEIKEDIVEKVVVKLKEIMEGVIKLKVPIIVDASAGDNWGEMKSISN
jgi:DNA polymerase-1